jgi:DNA-binding MarR family transcriptional regulator
MSARDVRLVQTCYPKIYLACHTRHVRAATSPHGLSPRDSALLAHLSETRATTPAALARHLGVGNATMSAAVKRLVRLGYVERARDPSDRRSVQLRLAQKGAAAMRASSVLESDRVRAVLARLSSSERRAALDGLALLARAAEDVMQEGRRA